MPITTLQAGNSLVSENTVDLPNGHKMVTEVIQTGTDSYITTNTMLDGDGQKLLGNSCGYCSGVLIGCVECRNNDPVLNCVNRTISCAS